MSLDNCLYCGSTHHKIEDCNKHTEHMKIIIDIAKKEVEDWYEVHNACPECKVIVVQREFETTEFVIGETFEDRTNHVNCEFCGWNGKVIELGNNPMVNFAKEYLALLQSYLFEPNSPETIEEMRHDIMMLIGNHTGNFYNVICETNQEEIDGGVMPRFYVDTVDKLNVEDFMYNYFTSKSSV